MSLTSIAIGLAHGIPVIIAVGFGRFAVIATAIVMALIAVMTGGGSYTGVDLLGVGIGFALGWIGTSTKSSSDQP